MYLQQTQRSGNNNKKADHCKRRRIEWKFQIGERKAKNCKKGVKKQNKVKNTNGGVNYDGIYG